MHRNMKTISLLLGSVFIVQACTTDPYTGEKKVSNTAIGAAIGAAAGAVGGVIVGGSNKRKAALIGAGIGTVVGGGVGFYMDQQEKKLRQQLQGTGVQVVRDGDNIILNMPGNITFDTDSSVVKADFMDVLHSVSLVLDEYEKTYVDVMGHTDSTGSDSYNLQLSQNRAEAVASVLTSKGVEPVRLVVRGFGEQYPIASNDTPSGRAQNRRVEIALSPVVE
ncbi:OmpA family protein [Kordiimonas gwangyangensis]|uniref:OmpA family protein n=1 Tax=Kordiimonas gwangyangensis TaxID=288022 RepID=UPI00037CF05E|nr:OmpA family protein [Kordiimonas gwangyangensis]